MDVAIACICPLVNGSPRHETGDSVTLRDTLDFRTATAIRKSFAFVQSDDEQGRTLEVLAVLTEAYLLFGVTAWTLVDEAGKPVPVSHLAIRERLMTRPEVASFVGDAADTIYNEVILLPLLERASTSSPPTPTSASTSAPRASSKKPPKRSRRSSTSTTPTAATATTTGSPDGVSSSSQSWTSAGSSGPPAA